MSEIEVTLLLLGGLFLCCAGPFIVLWLSGGRRE
jgi:hypothetical protein